MLEGHIPGPDAWSQADPEIAALTADVLVTEFALSDNWLKRHGIAAETEDKMLMQALQGALYRLMLDEARSEGVRIVGRLEEMAQDPGSSEDPAAEEVDLLRRKMAVSKRVGRLAGHFGSTILHTVKEEDLAVDPS